MHQLFLLGPTEEEGITKTLVGTFDSREEMGEAARFLMTETEEFYVQDSYLDPFSKE